jgi:hypothetical protein
LCIKGIREENVKEKLSHFCHVPVGKHFNSKLHML